MIVSDKGANITKEAVPEVIGTASLITSGKVVIQE
jgi:hypothetical protein